MSGRMSIQCSGKVAIAGRRTCVIASHPKQLPQLPNKVSLIYILGQPAPPEVVNQCPDLTYIGRTPHGYGTFANLAKP